MKKLNGIGGVLLTLLMAGVVNSPGHSALSSSEKEIARQANAFSAAFINGDADAIAELYTQDAVIFPTSSEMIVGRDKIREYWKWKPNSKIIMHKVTPTGIEVIGDVATDYGYYTVSGEHEGSPWGPKRGKYLIVWKRENDGKWRMQLDMWNSAPTVSN